MILFKCTKAFGMEEMAEESMKKADEIYAKEENDSHRELVELIYESKLTDLLF